MEATSGEGFNRVCSSMHYLQQTLMQQSYTHTQTQGHLTKEMSVSHMPQEGRLKN